MHSDNTCREQWLKETTELRLTRRSIFGLNNTKGTAWLQPVHSQDAPADVYGRSVLLDMVDYHTEEEGDLKPTLARSDVRITTQNVRGFKEKARWEWMAAWRMIPQASRPAMILLQETHVASKKERDELVQRWNWMWGRPVGDTPLSYWSIGSNLTGGVGILVFPETRASVRPWNDHMWTERVMGVTFQGMHIMNVYAPASDKNTREVFFNSLAEWQLGRITFPIVAGDFNSVESPILDRMGGTRSDRTESDALTRLAQQARLVDARVQLGSALEELELAPHEHYTYWRDNTASRLDRFYIPSRQASWLQWLQVQLPPVSSDHDEVTLHLRSPSTRSRRQILHRASYPIHGAHSARLIEEILSELNGKVPQRGPGYLRWDAWIKQCKKSVKLIIKRDQRRRQKKSSKLRRLLRENLDSRAKLLNALVEDIRDRSALRFGSKLERTPAEVRWLFRRTAVWERDQTVSNILPPTGVTFKEDMPIPERFTTVWASMMGTRHSNLNSTQMREAVARFATIPQERRVLPEDNQRLMSSISEDDVLAAITGLQRHKAGGEDGLNNDFYLDLAGAMVPRLVEVCNDLLQGHPPPESFLKAIVVPLRKKGDSSNALDYRPISLLQTSYKLFAKIVATRLQSFLGRLIGDTQQGFVHGRRMDKSVVMMLAQIELAISDALITASDSAGVLLLDFAKAYDTVDRIYLLEVLRQFGFSPEFVDLMARLHENTTAQFLVNGELSPPQEVKSGIRQGCPLAPLLFIIAVEFLALAIEQDPHLKGLEVHGRRRGCHHNFSAFVDDSTIFLEKSSQLPRVLELVKKFGKISGLHVQPAKSKYVFLNQVIDKKQVRFSQPSHRPGAEFLSSDKAIRYATSAMKSALETYPKSTGQSGSGLSNDA